MAMQKIKREHVGARVTEIAIKNCESIAIATGLSFSRVMEKAMEMITKEKIIKEIIKQK